ncbi:MAG: M56 family metallopeptidase [Lachnospiraceae bacterium]|nr:M56 family metallopeptidase [Lachnospiraceae bacterium]
MEEAFRKILELSITGGGIILIIIFIRIFLREVPGIFSYILWVIPAIRLLMPVTFTGIWGLVPDKTMAGHQKILNRTVPVITEDIIKVNRTSRVSAVHGIFYWIAFIWLAGFIFLLCCGIVSYIKLLHKLQVSVNLEENIYLADFIPAGFVMGIFNPRIYISSRLQGEEQKYIILHEKIHIKRHDYIFMLIAYILLCIHWFNPVVWLGFSKFVQDMEMSCDERVIKEAGIKHRKNYAGIVIQMAGRKVCSGMMAMFHGSNIKRRVKNIMKNKKNSRKSKIIAGAALFAAAVLLIPGFTKTNNMVKAEQDIPYMAAEPGHIYTNKYYSLVLPENCTVQEDGPDSFIVSGNKKIAAIMTEENFQYGGSADKIVSNWIGIHAGIKSGHSFLTDKNYKFYKAVVKTELSAAQEINGEEPGSDELHYFYISGEKLFIDVLVYDEEDITLAEKIIKTFQEAV